ncbi:Armadillo-type fold,Armadillo-like helical [Cinara cedri]|uniref:Armadillo-type fold,Armadillo-like helical n=1 Tax=Cinara cedri TaxID=506608 RepID=A0A5E4MLH6_9HEMI|nr:Armadillo-type fold,Armadillo-like helical [Cinara cedri]
MNSFLVIAVLFLKKYLELSVYIQQFKLDEELLETALKKFLILPPIFITDLQTLIVVLKLLNFALKKRILINKLNWVADALIKSESMHHNMADDFKNDEKSIKLCNQFFVELYEVYWLCLKNFIHFSTSNLTKLLFNQLSSTKNEFVLFQINMKCLTVLTENKKNIDNNLVKTYLSQIMSLKTILMNNSGEKNLQRNYLKILNHILHHTILVPNICEVWGMYDWESWTWSMIHSTDPLVRALVYQFSAGLAVIDITVSPNLIQLALNYFCESNRLENCVVAEQATIFCSNIFCNPKFKRLCLHYINKLDFNAFVQIINLCLQNDYTKSENKNFSTSPKLVANICCMLYNMFTLTELDLHQLDQNNQFVLALIMCLKRYLTPICIEKPNVMEMCGRICSILTLFIPTSNYSFENLITSLNLIYEKINIDLDHCTTMVWRSLFKLTNTVLQYTNNKSCIITDNLISALSRSITSKNNDLCNDALNTISAVCSKLSQKFAHSLCKVVIDTLILNWQQKLKRKILLITLSNIVLEHPFTYETVKQDNLLCFMITKLKIMQLQMTKQSSKNLKTLQNDYLEIVEFCCNIFHGCIRARENASSELPDIIHKLWPIVAANPKSDMLICTIQMLISLTSNCPSACSAMTMTSSTLGVDPKSKCTSYSLFHEIISLASDFHLHGDILNITLLLILNCCQAQECRIIIAKSKLLSNIVSVLDLKDKKRLIKIEQQCLNLLLIFSSYSEGQINILKIDYVLDTLVNLLNSNYKDDSIAILRNLCFNVQNRIIVLSSDVFMNGIKTMLEMGENLSSQQFKDISLALWAIAYKSQKSRLQLRHWGIDKYYEKCSNLLTHDNETQNIIKRTYQILKH